MPGVFPEDVYYDEQRVGQTPGMSLLDYFAGQAMAGGWFESTDDDEDVARACYRLAKAMMAVREEFRNVKPKARK